MIVAHLLRLDVRRPAIAVRVVMRQWDDDDRASADIGTATAEAASAEEFQADMKVGVLHGSLGGQRE